MNLNSSQPKRVMEIKTKLPNQQFSNRIAVIIIYRQKMNMKQLNRTIATT